MAKLKKILLMGVSYVLIAALAIGGTLAYLKDEDSAVNVMTLGNVSIEQHEYERVIENGEYKTDATYGYVLKDFTQAKPLYPATEIDANGNPINNGAGGWTGTSVRMTQVGSYGGMDVFASKNAQDKFITVENTGKTDAYVRTLVALELGDVAYTDFGKIIMTSTRSTTDNANLDQPWYKNEIGVIEIDGNNYVLLEFIYHGAKLSSGSIRHENGVLPAGDTTYPSLCQVYMTAAATNEDVEKIDGNKNGTYEILVVSQAVQANGFANAETALNAGFGDITITNHPWANPVSSVDELKEAIANGDTTVILDNDIALSEQLEVNGELTILGNGKTITAPANGTRVVNVLDNTEDVTVTLVGVKLDAADKERGISFYNNSGDLDVTIIDSEITAKYYGVNVAGLNAKATLNIKDSTLTGYCAFQTYSPNTIATFDNCVLEGVNLGYNNTNYPDANNFATVVVNSLATDSTLTFNNCTVIATEKDSATAPAGQWPATQAHIIDNATGTTINWNNCTFIKNGVEVSAPESIN